MKPGLILFLFVVLQCTVAWSEDAPLPDGWHAFPRKAKVLDADLTDSDGKRVLYPSTISKVDYFILQNEVHIETPLNTNGGDVLIVGNDVHIDAPIDTRIYFKPPSPYWKIPTPAQAAGDMWALDFELAMPVSRVAYEQLYNWGERYDDKTKRYIFSNSADVKIGFPELPSAPVPLTWGDWNTSKAYHFSDGEDAPDKHVIWKEVRSGNIKIFANRVTFCDACVAASTSIEQPSDGDEHDRNRGVFLNASGLKGGRGGAGSLIYCAFDRVGKGAGIFGSTCGNLVNERGGVSGKPGRGGDAGDIQVTFVNRQPPIGDLDRILKLSEAAGGVPVTVSRLRTPSYAFLVQHPNRTSFKTEGPPAVALADVTGVAGKITINRSDSDSTLNSVYRELSLAEASNRYDIKEIANSAQTDPNIFTILPTEILRPFLLAELKLLERQLLNSIKSMNFEEDYYQNYSALFQTMRCRRNGYLVDEETLILIEHLCEFRRFQSLGFVASYMYRTGGIFRTVSDVNVGTKHQEIVDQLSHIRDLLSKILLNLKDQDLRSYDSATKEERDRLATQVKILIATRDAIQAAADAHNASAPGFSDSLRKIGDVAKNFATAYAAIMAAQWEVAGPALYNGLKGFGDEISNANQFVPDNADTQEIGKAIDAANVALQDFVNHSSQIRQNMIVSQNTDLRDVVELRHQFDRRALDANYRFAELVRASLQGFLQVPFDPKSQLDQNIHIIDSAIADPQPEFRTLTVELVGNLCSTSPPVDFPAKGSLACVRLPRSKKIEALLANSGPLSGLPLAIVSPGTGYAIQSFGNLVDAEDVKIEELGVGPLGWR